MDNTVAATFEKRTRAFPLGPDNTALFLGRDYRHAIEGLREGVARGCRLLCLAGPAGIGKSMLLRTLRTQLPRGIISEISQPPLGGLLPRLAAGLGSDIPGDDEDAVQRCLLEYFAKPRQENIAVIQVIDDAETLNYDDLMLVRRLFESVQGQILLVGQPPLLSLFSADDGARTMIQPDRIFNLEPLLPDEVDAYIRHRLNEAGFDRDLFLPEAIIAVNAYSGGLPRLINLLCFTALASLEFDLSTPIASEHIHEAARQRMEIGNYPFMCPPLAPGWRPIPSSAAVRDDREGSHRRGDVDEYISPIPGDQRTRDDRSARFGYGRMLLPLLAGVGLGIMISRMSMMDSPGQADIAPPGSTTTMSRSTEFFLQQMKAGLVDIAKWIITWASPDSSSTNNSAMAKINNGRVTPPMAAGLMLQRKDTSNQPTVVHQAGMPSRSPANDNHPTVSDIQTPGTPRAYPAAIASPDAATQKPKSAISVTAKPSGHAGDSVTIEQPKQDDKAVHLTVAQREHIADLYADRAQYDIQANRLQDAQISIRRGLHLAPDDSRLQQLDQRVVASIAARQHETPQQTRAGQNRQKVPHISPSLPVQVVPQRKAITQPYLQQSKYEWPNRWQDTLGNIDNRPQEILSKPELEKSHKVYFEKTNLTSFQSDHTISNN